MNRETEYIGNPDQLIYVKTMRMEEGLARPVLETDVQCRSGITFTVLADRCMDIYSLRYKGINISYMNPCGIVAPQYYDHSGSQWLRSFSGGFLTTCGLDNTGSPCEENGKKYGMHGRISNIPAREYSVKRRRDCDEETVILSGEMNQSSLFGEKLKLKRQIRAWDKTAQLELTDEICNCGFEEEEFMILYHCNIGYPFLTPAAELVIDSTGTCGRDSYAEQYISAASKITVPGNERERCYYHEMKEHDGQARAGIYQKETGFGLILSYDTHVLRRFTQWNNFSKGQYVLGLEPGSNWVEGKKVERSRDVIPSLKPQESVKYTIRIQIIENRELFLKMFQRGQ